ncbi:hypothetical protein PFISCL1PPCAC_17764 [Pristionchus fissidentatus]|uniref:Uncharacterized protein n=1 Tax=Pristionchus fissidentatus TaxID=1538716 RepID=A0AAV5UPR6_9BILA|nr:hypothetical protein PFISCL1PPCAC_413 [Pristionchus fissidentatus]GMT26467.1 hypothetical protein PFISCL1PPCAC_17764 [Pristionchus fissidentatus]
MEVQAGQAEILKTIQSNMLMRPGATYNGPAFIAPTKVVQLAALHHSDQSFVRVLVDAVALPGEHDTPVMDRDVIRINFAMEQFRRLRSTGNADFESKWKLSVRRYNYNIRRRLNSAKNVFPGEEMAEDNNETD